METRALKMRLKRQFHVLQYDWSSITCQHMIDYFFIAYFDITKLKLIKGSHTWYVCFHYICYPRESSLNKMHTRQHINFQNNKGNIGDTPKNTGNSLDKTHIPQQTNLKKIKAIDKKVLTR